MNVLTNQTARNIEKAADEKQERLKVILLVEEV